MGVQTIAMLVISFASLISTHIIKSSLASQNDMSVSVNFPTSVKEGDNGTLTCAYDLKGKPLYTTRWYFNGDEVYRFTARPKQVKKVFQVAGVTVDVSTSALRF